jgi:hypothetical protein
MDIEGDEWAILDQLNEENLLQFKQIICEFHGFGEAMSEAWRQRAHRVLEKLHRTHQVIHLHGNNFAPMFIIGFVPLPDVLEVSFVRRSDYSFAPSTEVFPTELDAPNNPGAVDIFLGAFRFKPLKEDGR